jgi:hypothetical protein
MLAAVKDGPTMACLRSSHVSTLARLGQRPIWGKTRRATSLEMRKQRVFLHGIQVQLHGCHVLCELVLRRHVLVPAASRSLHDTLKQQMRPVPGWKDDAK